MKSLNLRLTFLLLFMCVTTAYGQDILIPTIKALEGNTLNVPIIIDKAPNNVESFVLTLRFDKARLTYKGIDKTNTLVDGFTMADGNLTEDGVVKIGGFDIGGGFDLGESGTLVKLLFELKEDACSTKTSSSLTLHDLSDNLNGWIVENGSIQCDVCTKYITSKAGIGGTISPYGDVTLPCDSSQSFTITPYAGYQIHDVKVDGSSLGALDLYTFEDVKENHSVEVSFVEHYKVPLEITDILVDTINSTNDKGQVILGSIKFVIEISGANEAKLYYRIGNAGEYTEVTMQRLDREEDKWSLTINTNTINSVIEYHVIAWDEEKNQYKTPTYQLYSSFNAISLNEWGIIFLIVMVLWVVWNYSCMAIIDKKLDFN